MLPFPVAGGVFSPGFGEKLGHAEQSAHLIAIGLVAVAVAMIMTPAALHRQAGARHVTGRFVRVSTRLLIWSMFPLAVSICIDFDLIARVIVGTEAVAWLSAATWETEEKRGWARVPGAGGERTGALSCFSRRRLTWHATCSAGR